MWKWFGMAILAGVTATVEVSGSESEKRATSSLESRVETLEERIVELEELIVLLRAQLVGSRAAVESTSVEAAPVGEMAATDASSAPVQTGGAGPVDDPGALRTYWNNGFYLETPKREMRLQIGGRIQNDWAFYSVEDDLKEILLEVPRNGSEFRRARVFVQGTVNNLVDFKAEYDFAGLLSSFRDVYIGFRNVPVVGMIQVGHVKEPFSLEELTSSRFITFLERASVTDAFAPSRNIGIFVQNTAADDRINWSAGLFRDTISAGLPILGDNSAWNVGGRLTGLPWYGDDGRKLLHLGFSFSHQRSPIGQEIFIARPESHLALPFLGTPFFDAEYHNLIGLESALVAGPFSVQGEYMKTFVEANQVGDPSFDGFYLQASYFPTGEHRAYRKSSASLDRIHPNESFLTGGGPGGWELAARYSFLNLDDAGIQGGRQKNFTFAVNWYVNPITRLMVNYIRSNRQDIGSAHIFQTRFAVDF